MKYYSLNVTAESPLAMRADHASTGADTAPYIAGPALMGSLAAAHRLFYHDAESDFRQLFLSEQIQYPHLYPATFKQKTLQDAPPPLVYPLPRTARSCKRFPGFEGDEGDDPPHGVFDSLFDWAAFELSGPSQAAQQLLKNHRDCAHQGCKKAMNHYSGYYGSIEQKKKNERDIKPEQQVIRRFAPKVETRVQTHTGINRSTGTVQENILYSRQVFEEGSRFSGVVKVNDEQARSFENMIGKVGESGLVRVGTGRSRGLGRVCLSLAELSAAEYSLAAFKERLTGFNQALHTYVEKYCAGPQLAPFYFALTLHSPTILRDESLRYRGSIDENMLAQLIGVSFAEKSLKLEYQNVGGRHVTGWNELWGTPRESEHALETGSVFLYSYQDQPDDLSEKLFALEESGIGQRRAEGFGRICVSDRFHWKGTLR